MGGQRIDTRAPTGKLMITMLGAISEFERGLLLERQREDTRPRGDVAKLARIGSSSIAIAARPT
jgi:DNA invertase Pin-like site-specific DNA recombinase